MICNSARSVVAYRRLRSRLTRSVRPRKEEGQIIARSRSAFEEIALAARFFRHLPGFLRTPLTLEACRARAREGLRTRHVSFLTMLERAVFARPSSPYRKLLDHAGITLGDVQELVRREGLEGALERLYDAGVYVTLAEFKGRLPVRRGNLVIETDASAFANPLAKPHVATQTGGSRSTGKSVHIDLDHYAQDAVYDRLFLEAFGLAERPYAFWRPPPPWNAGFLALFTRARMGLPAERWFSQHELTLDRHGWKHAALTVATVLAARLCGSPMPMPEHVPLAEAWRVATWLAGARAAGTPAKFNTNVASAVRICTASRERGLNIAGTVFRVGGEPLTPARQRVIEQSGARAVAHYSMTETGRIGMACSAPHALDDVHLLLDKVALIRRPPTTASADGVLANVLTTLLPTTPKLMLNVDSGDYGTVVDRRCGCLLDQIGYSVHLHTIRSYEKLTSEGMTFLGVDLVRLLEEVLPASFGGDPTDYQLIETEEEGTGLPRIDLVVSPRVGPVDEGIMKESVLRTLDASGGTGTFGDRWRQAGTLRVVRREPYATPVGKVLPLHVLRSA
jgi:hypothetical protein